MFPRDIFIRNIQAEEYFESFFISAISALFVVRFLLFLTNYPQLGGGGLHVAHMLWGGIIMFAAIILMLSFLSRTMLRVGAVVGGIGFGIFIDELGKFITSDNNYFFRPAVALIYVVFVVIYLLFRTIPKYKSYSEKEYLINALDMTKEAVINDLDIDEERLALEYLKMSDSDDPVAVSLSQLLRKIDAIEPGADGRIRKVRRFIRKIYLRLTKSQLLATTVIFFLILQSVSALIFTFYVIYTRLVISFDIWGVLLTALLSAVFVLYGMISLRNSKAKAYKRFKTAVLISILLTQFFLFYSAQFQALVTLFINIGNLAVIEYVLTAESGRLSGKLLAKTETKKT